MLWLSRLRVRQQSIPPQFPPNPPTPPKRFVQRLGKKILLRQGTWKKLLQVEKVPPPPHHFSNGPSNIVYFSRDIWSVYSVIQPHSEPMSINWVLFPVPLTITCLSFTYSSVYKLSSVSNSWGLKVISQYCYWLHPDRCFTRRAHSRLKIVAGEFPLGNDVAKIANLMQEISFCILLHQMGPQSHVRITG